MAYQFATLNVRPSFVQGHFFSFWTIQTNILAAATLVLTALVRRDERTRAFDAARTAVTLYITITGVVFAILLAGLQEDLDTHIGWVNTVVHYVIPAVLLADWLLDPPTHRLGMRTALLWLVYPALWFAYTLLRGRSVHWYPYPFVDVSRHGYGGVLARAAVFLGAFAAAACAFALVGDRLARRREDGRPVPQSRPQIGGT